VQEKISFCPPASALRDSWGSPRTLHTFANHTSRPTDRNLQKSATNANAQEMKKRIKKYIKSKKPKLIKFSYFPIVAYDNSYITIKWNINNCFIVRIDNKIGFRKRKGEYFTLIHKGDKFKLRAFSFFGIRTFELEPDIQSISKKEIKAVRVNNEKKVLKRAQILSISLKTKPNSTILNNKQYTQTKGVKLDIETSMITNELIEIQDIKSFNQLDKLKTKHHV
jgi:hypothetical protein